MGRQKGSKNKPKNTVYQKYYQGYFLLDTGCKIWFDIDSAKIDEDAFAKLSDNAEFPFGNDNAEFPFDNNDCIWLGGVFILAKRIAGFWIDSYEVEIVAR